MMGKSVWSRVRGERMDELAEIFAVEVGVGDLAQCGTVDGLKRSSILELGMVVSKRPGRESCEDIEVLAFIDTIVDPGAMTAIQVDHQGISIHQLVLAEILQQLSGILTHGTKPPQKDRGYAPL